MTEQQWRTMPATLRVRELRFTLKANGRRTRVITIATTLLDPRQYPQQKIADLYGVRWQVETHFGELKTTLKMRRIKSRTAVGVQKELAVYALVYNLVHTVMLEAARRQKTTPDRISFIDTVRWLLSAEPGEALPDLLINPSRPDRHEPRVVKDRQDSYPYLNKPALRATQNSRQERERGKLMAFGTEIVFSLSSRFRRRFLDPRPAFGADRVLQTQLCHRCRNPSVLAIRPAATLAQLQPLQFLRPDRLVHPLTTDHHPMLPPTRPSVNPRAPSPKPGEARR